MIKRSAYTLLEMMAIIAAIVVIMALSVKPVRTLVADVPRANRDFQTWLQTQDMLTQLRRDIQQSTRMEPAAIVSDNYNSSLLRLQQPEKLVSYSFSDDKVLRRTNGVSDHWDLPHVHIKWDFLEHNETPYALEITTWTERTVFQKTQKKNEQSYVYFLNNGSLNP